MSRTYLMPAAFVASLFFSALPALAQHRGGNGGGGHASASHAVPRGSVQSAPAPRTYGSMSRGYGAPGRVYSSPGRVYSAPGRVYSAPGRIYGPSTRGAWGPGSTVYAQSRGGYRGSVRVGGGYGHGGYGGYGYGGYYGRRTYVAPIRYAYPYYSFRPRFSIGFGIFAGYPIGFSTGFYYGYPYYYSPYYAPYPYYDYAPYPYSYYPPAYYPPAGYGYPTPYTSMDPYPSGYPADPQQEYPAQSGYPEPTAGQPQPDNSMLADPGTVAGGISFEITPATAAVIIDGTYVGRVSDLGPTSQPMGLKPGRHHVEIRAAGHETVTFDADIVSGQVLPYKGQMQPIR